MPLYEYACKACGQHLEVSQSFKDEPLTTCPACEGPLRKVFNSIGISFKGSGFYRTDSRPALRKDKERDGERAGKGEKADKADKASDDGGGGGKNKGGDSSTSGDKGDKNAKSDRGSSGASKSGSVSGSKSDAKSA